MPVRVNLFLFQLWKTPPAYIVLGSLSKEGEINEGT